MDGGLKRRDGGKEGREGGRDDSYLLRQPILPPLEHSDIHVLLLVHPRQVAPRLLPTQLGALETITKPQDIASKLSV